MAETAQGIELKLADGSVIKADDINEALKTAVKMKEDTSAALKTEREQREALQTRVEELQRSVQAQRPKEHTNGFDNERYFKLLNEDPLAAANYVDSVRFQVQDPVGFITENFEKITRMEGQSLAAGFTSNHPEFPQDAESAKIMTGRVVQLTKQGHPANLATMELAWMELRNEGALKPVEEEQPEEQTPPPSPGGTGGVNISQSEIQKFEQMSTREQEAYLRSKGLL